jgi:catecholate siderophore receptor
MTRLLVLRPAAVLILATLTSISNAITPAAAQNQGAAAAEIAPGESDTLTKRAFLIPAQALPAALDAFTRQSGIRVIARAGIPDTLSPAVIGRFTPPDALRRLVAGTGLAARAVDDHTLAVVEDDTRAYMLDPVEVVARRPASDAVTSTATRTPTPLRDVPQAVTVVSRELIADQGMQSMADVARYVPGVTMGQGEGNRDQVTIRGNNSTSTFFVNGVRDDVQYFRDLYYVVRVEALKGRKGLIFGRVSGGGVINRVT